MVQRRAVDKITTNYNKSNYIYILTHCIAGDIWGWEVLGLSPNDRICKLNFKDTLDYHCSWYVIRFWGTLWGSSEISVCMRVCTCVCMYVCMYVYICTHAYLHMYMHTYICKYACMYIWFIMTAHQWSKTVTTRVHRVQANHSQVCLTHIKLHNRWEFAFRLYLTQWVIGMSCSNAQGCSVRFTGMPHIQTDRRVGHNLFFIPKLTTY